jgi:hypothetical protein
MRLRAAIHAWVLLRSCRDWHRSARDTADMKKPACAGFFCSNHRAADHSDSHHIQNASHRRLKKPASGTSDTATSGACATTLPSRVTLTVPMA